MSRIMYYQIVYRYYSIGNRVDGCYLYQVDWRGKKLVRRFETAQKALNYLRKVLGQNPNVTVYPPRGEALNIWEDWPEDYRLPKGYI